MIKKIVAFTFLIISTVSFAQNTNASPYSFFGIGDQAKIKSVEEIAMGEMGGALNSEYQMSFTNPATYGSLIYTNYVFSAGNKATSVDDGENVQSSSTAKLTYIALGIPIHGNQGLAFGLMLNTAVGYSLLNSIYDEEDVLTETNLFTGDGGTNRAFIGYGYQFPFDLSLGFEVAYIFGGIEKSILNRRSGVQLATRHETISFVKGYNYKLGAHYSKDISDQLKLKLGATFELENDLDEKGDQYLYSLDNTGEEFARRKDTISNIHFNTVIKTPLKTILSAGVGQEHKWFIGGEYSFQDAIEFDGIIYEDNSSYYYTNSSVMSIGGFFTPKYNSISSYWNRATYRAGFNYKKLGLVINNTEIDDYGISFGVSLPIGKRLSNANFGIELGKRGTTENNLVEENYFNFRISLSLNDKWFRKSKIN